MAQGDARSLQQIKEETERTRAELTHTVEQLRDSVTETSRDIRERMKPAAIRSEMSNYVRTRGERWLDDLKVAVQEHPLQAVAIGGGLAYPLSRLVRAIPMPILMIGAGLYLARSGNEKALTDQVSAAADGLRQRVTEQVANMQDGAAQKTGSATETVQDAAAQATAAGQRSVEAAKDTAQGAIQSAKATASDLRDRATKTFADTLEQNPLVVAGVGLLIGGVIAGALPRTDLEDELLGESSQSIKRRAWSAASQGIDTATDAAGDAARRASGQAKEEGIDPEGMRDKMRDVGERVRHVAEAAVTTAFEPPEENGQSDNQGASNHG